MGDLEGWVSEPAPSNREREEPSRTSAFIYGLTREPQGPCELGAGHDTTRGLDQLMPSCDPTQAGRSKRIGHLEALDDRWLFENAQHRQGVRRSGQCVSNRLFVDILGHIRDSA